MGEQPSFRPHILSVTMSDVEPENVTWLWPDRFPHGKLTLIVGDPGLGKSFLATDVAARLSSGTPWPDRQDEPVEPGNVIILSAEDDLADTIRPRLDAAGADPSRIHAVIGVKRVSDGGRCYFSLDADLTALEEHIVRMDARLVILDPITAFLGSRADGNSNTDIRAILGPLSDLAAKHLCAILAVSHLNKQHGGRAMYRTMGSLAFTAAARSAWLIAKDKHDERRRLMLSIKNNLVEDPKGIAFQIEGGCLHWFPEPIDIDADSVLANDDAGERTERNAAADWLTELLARGPMPVKDIRGAAEADCHKWRTVERAKQAIGVRASREGYGSGGRYVWSLPDVAVNDPP